jgi:hypothetical protein
VSSSENYFCGEKGLLLQGNDIGWGVLNCDPEGEDFWAIARFEERIYIAGWSKLYVLEGNEMVEVDTGLGETTKKALFATGSQLWSVGEADLAVFEKEHWSKVEWPEWLADWSFGSPA